MDSYYELIPIPIYMHIHIHAHAVKSYFFSNPAKVAWQGRGHSGQRLYHWKEGPNGCFIGFPTPHSRGRRVAQSDGLVRLTILSGDLAFTYKILILFIYYFEVLWFIAQQYSLQTPPSSTFIVQYIARYCQLLHPPAQF